MATLKQIRGVNNLPKHNFKIKPAMIEAGYKEGFADKNGKQWVESEGVQQLLKDKGFTRDFVISEYRKIAKQDKDLTNKRRVLEKIGAKIDPDLDFMREEGGTGNTTNIINILDDKMREALLTKLQSKLLNGGEQQQPKQAK